MTTPVPHEFEYIDWVRRQSGALPLNLVAGIGDDAAVQRLTPGWELLIAKDVLMEGTHFTFPEATPQQAGRKALAVNLSDIAAMGGRPTTAFIGLVLPRVRGPQFARDIHTGIAQLAAEFSVAVAGGDTNIWDGPLVISVTLLGEVEQGMSILRSGAQPGDVIFVTGPLGGSLASRRHLNFTPRVELARRLKASGALHSMIDISDGLARDLGHILEESGTGARLNADCIPIHPDVIAETSDQRWQHAMSDGEDFELVCTVAPAAAARIQAEFPEITPIGVITSALGFDVQDATGRAVNISRVGYEHTF